MERTRFTLLGPLRVSRGGEQLALGPRQQRLMLALLLARARNSVSVNELIDLLWPECPPDTAVNVVYRYIGSLRRLLEPGLPPRATGRWLLGTGGQYRMQVDADSLDLLQFRREIERSHQAADAGRHEEALTRAASAVDHWRGRCAAGLDEATLSHPTFVALENECSAAVRYASELALATGRPSAVLPALRRSADRNPFDEALHGRLMLLMAADGQTADAVRVFHSVRQRLVRHLGVEPGADLEETLRTVLRGSGGPSAITGQADQAHLPLAADDVAARSGDGPMAPMAFVRPAQLPRDHAYFTGRRRIAAALLAQARGRATCLPVLGIDGIPGVGKTTLAVHLAHELAAEYRDGQLYANLRGFGPRRPVRPLEVLRSFLSALGVPFSGESDNLENAAGLFRSVVAERRVLILLDNVADVDQVMPLLPGNRGCLVIVTSRTRLTSLATRVGAHLLTLDVPDAEEAQEILVAGGIDDQRAEIGMPVLTEILERCGRLPLAVSLVAARIREFSPATILAELRSARHDLDAFTDENLSNELRAVFSWSYQKLTPEASRLFRMLSVHPGPDVTIPAMACLIGIAEAGVRPLVAELTRTGLVSQHRHRRYRMHALMAVYATELASKVDRPEDIEASWARLYEYYEENTRNAGDVIAGYGHDQRGEVFSSGLEWFIEEYDVLYAIGEAAAARGQSRQVWRMTLLMQLFFQHDIKWRQWREAAQFALDVSRRSGDIEGEAQMNRSLAGACLFLDEKESALRYLDDALLLFEKLDMPAERALVIMNQCRIALALQDYSQAIRLYRDASALMRKYGLRHARASALQVMAVAFLERQPRAAAMFARRCAALSMEIGHLTGMAICDNVLARLALGEGRIADALEHQRRGISRLTPERKQPNTEAYITLGDILAACGKHLQARAAWMKALDYCDDPTLALGRDVRRRLERSADGCPDCAAPPKAGS